MKDRRWVLVMSLALAGCSGTVVAPERFCVTIGRWKTSARLYMPYPGMVFKAESLFVTDTICSR